jgi:dipeptidase D
MAAGYERLFGEKPEITAVHAGLECGIIGGVYPAMDMISCGPTIRFPHSPDEEVNIASVERFWRFLADALETAPAK